VDAAGMAVAVDAAAIVEIAAIVVTAGKQKVFR
jgi:hypothetical protein